MAVGSNGLTSARCQEILHNNSHSNTKLLVSVTLSLSSSLGQIKPHLSSLFLCVKSCFQGVEFKFKIFNYLAYFFTPKAVPFPLPLLSGISINQSNHFSSHVTNRDTLAGSSHPNTNPSNGSEDEVVPLWLSKLWDQQTETRCKNYIFRLKKQQQQNQTNTRCFLSQTPDNFMLVILIQLLLGVVFEVTLHLVPLFGWCTLLCSHCLGSLDSNEQDQCYEQCWALGQS